MQGERTIVRQLVPLPNSRSDSARDRYEIDPGPFFVPQKALDGDGLEIVGIYHSHPDHPRSPRNSTATRLAALELRDRRRRGGALGRHEKLASVRRRTAFARTHYFGTTEGRMAVTVLIPRRSALRRRKDLLVFERGASASCSAS